MANADLTRVRVEHLVTHHVGNKLNDGNVTLSTEETAIDEDTRELLLKYFLLPVKTEEVYSFAHAVKLDLNEVFNVVRDIFEKPRTIVKQSQNIAKLLFEQSVHPKVKEGELNVVYLSNANFEGETLDAIGIFKSESNTPFLKMRSSRSHFEIVHDHGFDVKGIDKGAIIFNTLEDHGYRILIVDTANRGEEAQYWKTNFLNVLPVANEFHQTKQFLGIAKEYVAKQMPEEFEISKPDQIDLLNRSLEYFKNHNSFDRKGFEKEVLQDTQIIKSFREFDNNYRDEHDIHLEDSFDISTSAIKKQMRTFKSVLKLDKNFHIYIHGDRDLIEHGVDRDGRKYYKIYYEQEA